MDYFPPNSYPPSAMKSEPVIYDAFSEAKNKTKSAISLGVPILPNKVPSFIR